jgi:hypothetical protein
MGEQRGVMVHEYNTTSYAYDETQTNDEIHDGDVIIALDEGVVGILDQAWPFAVTEAHGEFHGPPLKSAHLIRDGELIPSLAVALGKARELGFPVSPLNAPVITATPEKEPEPEPEREIPCPSCEDGSGDVPIYHHSLDAVIGWRKCDMRRNHPVSLVKREPWPPPCDHTSCCGSADGKADCPPF